MTPLGCHNLDPCLSQALSRSWHYLLQRLHAGRYPVHIPASMRERGGQCILHTRELFGSTCANVSSA